LYAGRIIWLTTYLLAIDSPELTDMVHDLGASNKFRQEARDQFNRYLADEPAQVEANDSQLSPPLRSFIPVGEALAFITTKGQRAQILDELHKYVDACEYEQLSELSGQAPAIGEYLRRRMGTSAVGFVVANLEWVSCRF
jgi:hypothetical protein